MTTDNPDVLEQNVATLLETGGARPRISEAARVRIRAQLIANHGVVGARRTRAVVMAAGVGLAAIAAAALIASRWVGDAPAADATVTVRQVAGAEVVGEPGAKVIELAARHLRIEGAALIDVEPGKGPFIVETAHGRIEVLGTRFMVDGERERTAVAVLRGQVKLATERGDVVVHAGEQGVAEPGHPPVRGPAPRLSSLVSWARLARHRDEHAARPPHRGTLFARAPSVRSDSPGPEYPLPITRLGLDVVVEDQIARVALDQTFHNPANQTLEGVYRFAIPPDAALQRLAMYVDGQLMESAVVERMQARRIYEQLVVRRVDPALLEWAGNGRLLLRIYPIPALQDKRLMLAYTHSLPRLYDDWTLIVPLPEVDQPVGTLDVSVRVKGCANCELTSPSYPIAVVRRGDDAIVTYREAGAKLGDSFVLHVRDSRRHATIARSERGGDRYLMVRTPGALVGAAPAYRPRTWVILDDVSASRDRFELRAQADVVDALLREFDEQDRVAVIAFDVEAREKLAPTRVLDIDRRAVRAALASEGGVGATDVGAALDAALTALAGTAPGDAMIVYLGDGVITDGARNLDALRGKLTGKAQFIGVGIGDGPDTQTLQSLASATGGYVTTIDLADDLDWRAFDLVATLHTSRVTGLDARLVDASGHPVPSTTYLASPQLADGEELELVSKLAGGGAPAAVELTGTLNGTPWRRSIALDGTPNLAAGYLPRLWAQRHIAARLLAKHEPVVVPPCATPACPGEAELREQRDEAIRKEVVRLGKQYFLLSRHTSLLVLENDAMYTQYGVTKGAGDTWAPYAMPKTLPAAVTMAATQAPPANAADDTELIRMPRQVLYSDEDQRQYPRTSEDAVSVVLPATGIISDTRGGFGAAGAVPPALRREPTPEPVSAGSEALTEPPSAPLPVPSISPKPSRRVRDLAQPVNIDKTTPPEQADAGTPPEPAQPRLEMRAVCDSSGTPTMPTQRVDVPDTACRSPGCRAGGRLADLVPYWAGAKTDDGRWRSMLPITAWRVELDDLTEFVPALFRDAVDHWRDQLGIGRGAPHQIDDAARSLLAEARRGLPTGIYRWGGVELALDSARRIGWRRTTPAGLVETASFDGMTWTRRYAELGLDVTRAMSDDDIALAFGYLPVWIADPSHYAAWFDVTARGDREVVLSRRVGGTPKAVLVLRFDDRSRLVEISDDAGTNLVEITWDVGPVRARVLGEPISVGFTGQAISDAARWAHRDDAPDVVVELPVRPPDHWCRKLAAEAVGGPGWRHGVRQIMVARAALRDREGLWHAYEQQRTHGGVSLGDLVLASTGVATTVNDQQFAEVIAPLASHPVARYLIAFRAYDKSGQPEQLASPSRGGLVGGLWSLRAATAHMIRGHGKAAVDELVAIGDHAPELRLIGAASFEFRWGYGAIATRAGDVVRAWDLVAVGDDRNVARLAAAQALSRHEMYDASAECVAKLVADLDLDAAPARLDYLMYAFQHSRRGLTGWNRVWAAWRDRVLSSTSFRHTMTLLAAAPHQTRDVMPFLARATELAGTDASRRLEVARAAIELGNDAWAEPMIRQLLETHPSQALYQLAADLERRHGRFAEALADLEAAQAAAADDAVELSTVHRELDLVIETAQQLAIRSTGATRAQAVRRAMDWGNRWRAIDPGNAWIDQRLGELQLAVGDHTAAWRQLSSLIERDRWTGTGYALIAEVFERRGDFAAALPFWQQAIVIDQTNPTPRLRKAQALIALGRTAEGDALLAEILAARWHNEWNNVLYQASALLARRQRGSK